MAVESPPQLDIISDGSFLPVGRKVSSRAILEHRLVQVHNQLSNHQDKDIKSSMDPNKAAQLRHQRTRTMSALGIEGNPDSPEVNLLIAGISNSLQQIGLPYWRSHRSIKKQEPDQITSANRAAHELVRTYDNLSNLSDGHYYKGEDGITYDQKRSVHFAVETETALNSARAIVVRLHELGIPLEQLDSSVSTFRAKLEAANLPPYRMLPPIQMAPETSYTLVDMAAK